MSLGQIGKYELLRHLGNGAFGDVFLAHDHALNTQKAIKVLNAPDANDVMKNLKKHRFFISACTRISSE